MSVAGEQYVAHYFPGTGASYDRVVGWTTLGLDRRWKRRMLDQLPSEASNWLELACGTGILTRMILDRFPSARVLGIDVTEDYLRIAREGFRDDPRVELRQGDATTARIADRGPFAVVISSYLPKYVDPRALVDHVTPSLRPGGIVVLHDFVRPRAVVPRLVWRAWMATLDFVAPLVHPEWRNVFDHSLPRLIATSRWVALLRFALGEAGYADVRRIRLSGGSAAIVVARRT